MINVGFSITSSSFPMKRLRTLMSQGLGRACCQYVQDNTIQFTCIYKSITTIQASLDFAKNAIGSKDKDIGDYYCYLIFKEQDRILQYSFPVHCQPTQNRMYPPSDYLLINRTSVFRTISVSLSTSNHYVYPGTACIFYFLFLHCRKLQLLLDINRMMM